jgi:hypothetical protein
MNESIKKYLAWLDRSNPEMYAAVYERMQSGGLGATETAPAEKSWLDMLTDTVKDLAPVYLATEQQKRLNELNLERARNNQPPLDASQAASVTAQVGLSPQTQYTILGAAGLLAVGLGAVMLRPKRGRR